MSGKVSSKIVTDGLVLNLDGANPKSYMSGSTIWDDLTYYKNNGTLTNGPTFDTNNGGSIVFDGVNDYINLGTSIGKLVQFTISVWLKPNNWNNCGIVFSSNTGGGQGPTHWGLWGRGGGNIEVFVSNGITLQVANTNLPWSSLGVPTSSYTNIVITINGLNISLFKNSIQVGSNIIQTVQQSGIMYDLCIGKNPADTGYFYNGLISNTYIYNRALSPSEVLQNYNALKNRFI